MTSQLKPPVNEHDHMQGPANARMELVEYGDYQCPFCGRAYPIIKAIQHTMGNRLKFVFRNFPLSTIHPDAISAALAAEAAGLQNMFWEAHDTLFEHQAHLGDVHLISYARKLGLDIPRFRQDMAREDMLERVETDFETGVRSGVNGTPTFFINGKRYTGNWEDGVTLLTHLQQLAQLEKVT